MSAKRYAVLLSSASHDVDGPELVRESMRRMSLPEAAVLAGTIAHAQPGLEAAVVERTPSGWLTRDGLTPREWLATI